jgi:Mrp family chromosome partitioning ATPase
VGCLLAVYSCKGGVGKSTVATNLAYSLAARGGRVGIFDADIYGPSLPVMISPEDTTIRSSDGKTMLPLEYEGVRCMSYGFASPDGTATVARVGLGRFVTLCCRSSTSYQIHQDNRFLYL